MTNSTDFCTYLEKSKYLHIEFVNERFTYLNNDVQRLSKIVLLFLYTGYPKF